MAIVSTLAKACGGQPTFYDVPDADLQKYEALNIRSVGEDEGMPEEAGSAEQIEAPGAAMPESEVQAYGGPRICRGIGFNRRPRYLFYWYSCYASTPVHPNCSPGAQHSILPILPPNPAAPRAPK